MAYAARTKVPVAKTRQELDAALRRAGATRIITMDEPDEAVVACEFDRQIRIRRQIDPKTDEQERRTIWRNIDQVVRGKLAGVDMPDGRTVYETTREAVALAYETGEMRPHLPAPKGER